MAIADLITEPLAPNALRYHNLRDEGDNHVIELAIAGNAQIIATNNLRDFRGSELTFPQLQILSPHQIIKT